MVLEEADGIIQAAIHPGDNGMEYSDVWLNTQIEEQEFFGIHVLEAARTQLTKLLKDNTAGLLTIGERRDASVEVIISSDSLTATLVITTPEGGVDAGMEMFMQALKKASISPKLIDNSAMIQMLIKAKRTKPGTEVKGTIATGEAVEHGLPTRFECLVDNMIDRKPSEREDGSLNYYDRGDILTVKEGQELMRRLPPTAGKNGITVTGKNLSAKPGKQIPFDKCKGAKKSESDPNLLVADTKGQPILLAKGMSIIPVFTIDDVNINVELIKRGFAWHYKFRAKSQSAEKRKSYADAEKYARTKKLGLWQEKSPIPPWDFRKRGSR